MTQELINQFFRNECNEEERKRVLQYFEENPGEWDKYINEEDWENFETKDRLHPAVSQKLFEAVSRNTIGRRKPVGKLIAMAASIALLAGLAWVLMVQQKNATNTITDNNSPQLAEIQWQERVNTTGKAISITLEDGSVATLSPHSSIRFYSPFYNNNKRMIFLQGEGTFKVAKDPIRPFTVYADDVATTALGTEFKVTSFKESNEIKVALYEGKVVVNASDSVHKKWKQNMYLAPGDELVYNKQTMLASIKRAKGMEQLVKAGASYKKNSTIQKPNWYEFNGSPLAEVLDQLSAYYQVDIYYYPADIGNKYFAGKMRKSDSLEIILNDIAKLNRLSIDRKNGSYIIKKNQ